MSVAGDGGAFVIARRHGASRLPIVLRLPLADGDVVLATRDTWPAAKDLFCAELSAWPDDAEVLERVAVGSCRRVGASIQLVLERPQRRRSLFVWTSKGGRPLVFWRSERSMRSTRPGVRTPTARGLEGPLTIAVDERERYAWRFKELPVTLERRRLPVGDYAVYRDERLVAVVERKRLEEFAGAAVDGSLQLALAELATMPRAAVVIEGRLAQLVKGALRTRPGWLLNVVASLQAAYPNVPLLFADAGPLAADLAYRWLSASLHLAGAVRSGVSVPDTLGRALGAGYGNAATSAGASAGASAPPSEAPLFDVTPTLQPHARHAPPARAHRQHAALERARAGETLSVKAHAERFAISTATASLDLWELERRGALRATGSRRSLRFSATPRA